MKYYTATASCDWGYIYSGEKIAATSWRTAFARAGKLAHERARRRPGMISIRLDAIKLSAPVPVPES